MLDKKHHQERDDRRARVDDELPGVGKLKDRPGHRPYNNEGARDGKGGRTAALPGRPLRGRIKGSAEGERTRGIVYVSPNAFLAGAITSGCSSGTLRSAEAVGIGTSWRCSR